MLIIAIPKSASTSLLKTLSDTYNLPGKQDYITGENTPKEEYTILWKYHSDMKEISTEHAIKWTRADSFFKQHVLPTSNNQALLTNHKKVILLRDPTDIILSYRRTQLSGLSKERIEFRGCKTEEDWISHAERIGLMADLKKFYNKWMNHSGDRIIVNYSDFISNSTKEVNRIAEYWDLSKIQGSIEIARERYTRVNYLHRIKNRLKRYIKYYRKKLSKS